MIHRYLLRLTRNETPNPLNSSESSLEPSSSSLFIFIFFTNKAKSLELRGTCTCKQKPFFSAKTPAADILSLHVLYLGTTVPVAVHYLLLAPAYHSSTQIALCNHLRPAESSSFSSPPLLLPPTLPTLLLLG